MFQPDELKKNEPLLWSTGTGTDVWRMFCAAKQGDVKTIESLLQTDPSLARCQYAYRTPLDFAVRENQIAAAALLLERGTDPIGLSFKDSLVEICRDRGYALLQGLLESKLASVHGASAEGEPVAAAIREGDVEKVRRLLDASPELLHTGDGRSNQPIHWAVMTRQLEMIDELLARGANINARRLDGPADSAHERRLQFSRVARCEGRGTASHEDVLAHLLARGASCRHLHGREHR